MTSPANGSPVAGLEPRNVWEIFAGIAAVPRPSKHEERIRKHVREFAERNRLAVREDKIGNLTIDVPASPGKEKAPVTVLQAHLDMVCEKNSGTPHDFDKEGIRMVLDKDKATGERIVRGEGTTLGADNGIGVALALAAATSADVVRGPLELLFTLDEEDGMSGAKALTSSSFRARRLINLDSEEDDALYIGCAGGCDTNLAWSLGLTALDAGSEACQVSVTGLRGGHSGGDIHEGRANAIKLLARTLGRAPAGSLRLITITGGSKRNAIPREGVVTVAGPKGTLDALKEAAKVVANEAKNESFEPEVNMAVQAVRDGAASAVSVDDTNRLLAALTALPSGVLGMHPKVDGLVETSNNISTVVSETKGSKLAIKIGTLSRSSSGSRIQETLDQIAAIGRLTGAEVSTGNRYPGWAPNPDSPTLAICRRVYKDLFGKEPHVAAIHAGLECGIIGERVGSMDMVSLGPTIRGAHSPDERVYIDSVERTWRYLKAVLAALS